MKTLRSMLAATGLWLSLPLVAQAAPPPSVTTLALPDGTSLLSLGAPTADGRVAVALSRAGGYAAAVAGPEGVEVVGRWIGLEAPPGLAVADASGVLWVVDPSPADLADHVQISMLPAKGPARTARYQASAPECPGGAGSCGLMVRAAHATSKGLWLAGAMGVHSDQVGHRAWHAFASPEGARLQVRAGLATTPLATDPPFESGWAALAPGARPADPPTALGWARTEGGGAAVELLLASLEVPKASRPTRAGPEVAPTVAAAQLGRARVQPGAAPAVGLYTQGRSGALVRAVEPPPAAEGGVDTSAAAAASPQVVASFVPERRPAAATPLVLASGDARLVAIGPASGKADWWWLALSDGAGDAPAVRCGRLRVAGRDLAAASEGDPGSTEAAAACPLTLPSPAEVRQIVPASKGRAYVHAGSGALLLLEGL